MLSSKHKPDENSRYEGSFRQCESGQASLFFAAFMGVLAMGFLAMAIDVGVLFRAKNQAQAAADAAAMAAAEELTTSTSTDAQAAAKGLAKLNGFDTSASTNPATVTLSTPGSGNFTGSSYVQVTVSKPFKTFFLGAFSRKMATLPVAASAVAGGAASTPTCVCLKATSGQALNMSNNAKLVAPSCGVVDNSNSSNALGIVGSSTLNALTLGTVSSTWNNSSNINNGGSISSSTTIIQGISSQCSPTMPAVPAYSSCAADPGGSYGTFTWGPASASGVVCYKGLTIGTNGSSVTLKPGIYVITTGSLHFLSGSGGHSNLGGNGVFFYLTAGASLTIDNGANVNLVAGGSTLSDGSTAPTVGSYNGILIYQDSSDTNAMSVQGGATSYMHGSLYAPSAAMNLGNGSGSTLKGGIVANTLTMTGGATLTAVADVSQGGLVTGSSKLVQ